MRTSWLALVTFATGLAGVIAACGGADAMDVLGEPGQATASSSGTSGATSSGATSSGTTSGSTGSSSGSSGSTTSSSGSTSSSTGGTTDACAACPTPPAGCLYPTPCNCSYVCPDAGGPVKCVWSKAGDGCPAGSYCDAPDCGQGVCVRKGLVETQVRDPQCGCNGVTYWNTSVARKAGMAIRSAGSCKSEVAAVCGGLVHRICPVGASCSTQVTKKSECNIADAQGTCWGLPATCPAIVIGGRAHACSSNSCSDDCTVIRKEVTWYDDGSCPQ